MQPRGAAVRKAVVLGLILVLLALRAGAEGFTCTVQRVIDGDTFICSGQKVRLTGVDTPESQENPRAHRQARTLGDISTVLELGRKARTFSQSLLPPGTVVRLEFDVQKRDKYGRLLAYVWLPDGRMLNEVLLEEGYAVLLTIPPNVKYVERFREAQRRAREAGKGLWGEK